MAEVKVKTITYDNLPEELKEDPKILRFPYKKPFKEEIEEFQRKQDSRRGIMSTQEAQTIKKDLPLLAQMSERQVKEYLGGFLRPYGFSEEQILKMPMWEIEYHLENVMRL